MAENDKTTLTVAQAARQKAPGARALVGEVDEKLIIKQPLIHTTMRKLLTIALIGALALGAAMTITSCSKEVVNATGVEIDAVSDPFRLAVGETETLTASVSPDGATDKRVTWSSSSDGVVTVDDTGKLTTLAEGTATITATTADGGMTDRVTLTVEGVLLNGTVWASRNVGAQPGTFAARPEAYGGYYMFEQAQTACPDGWQLPTANEYNDMIIASYDGSISVDKRATINGASGHRYGRPDYPAAVVFFPRAGWYNQGGNVVYQEIQATYWTRTIFNRITLKTEIYNGTATDYWGYYAPHASEPDAAHPKVYRSVRCVRR